MKAAVQAALFLGDKYILKGEFLQASSACNYNIQNRKVRIIYFVCEIM